VVEVCEPMNALPDIGGDTVEIVNFSGILTAGTSTRRVSLYPFIHDQIPGIHGRGEWLQLGRSMGNPDQKVRMEAVPECALLNSKGG